MAHYRPDRTLNKAIKVIEELGDSEKDQLIKYYIEKKEEHIKNQRNQIQGYADFFKMLDRFLPNKNTIYG